MLLGVGIQGLVEWALVEVAGWKSAVRVSSGMPLPGGVLWDLIRGLALREVRYVAHELGGGIMLMRDRFCNTISTASTCTPLPACTFAGSTQPQPHPRYGRH